MIRQDAWNQDEDLLLAETVLRHIREGGTQLAAFDEVGEKLSRTSAACGFRWNSSVRKQYDSAIQLAKKVRKEAKRHKVVRQTGEGQGAVSFQSRGKKSLEWYDEIIRFLMEQKEQARHAEKETFPGVEKLKEENRALKEELTSISKAYEDVKKDYQIMIHALEKAAKKENTS